MDGKDFCACTPCRQGAAGDISEEGRGGVAQAEKASGPWQASTQVGNNIAAASGDTRSLESQWPGLADTHGRTVEPKSTIALNRSQSVTGSQGPTGSASSYHQVAEFRTQYYTDLDVMEASMIRTIQAVIGKNGEVRLVEPVTLDGEYRALVMIMDEVPAELPVLACEPSLSEWNLPEEYSAWMHLQ